MEKGFSRLWVICNTLICNAAMFAAFSLNSVIDAKAQQVVEPAIITPQLRPDNSQIANDPGKEKKPAPVYRSACPALLEGKFIAAPIMPIKEGECGERSPLLLSGLAPLNGLSLKPAAQVNCRMATALAEWGGKINAYAKSQMGAEIDSITVGNGYQCRRRNNLPDGKISEHGFANALDITGFKFSDGRSIAVEKLAPGEDDSSDEETAEIRFLEFVQQKACEKFTTVLGPRGDEHHKDHFHLDLGCHGKKCTYRICQ